MKKLLKFYVTVWPRLSDVVWRVFLLIFVFLVITALFIARDNTFQKIPVESETQYLEWKVSSAQAQNQTLVLPYSTGSSLSDFTISARLPELNSTSMLILKCRYDTVTAKIDSTYIYASDIATIAGRQTKVGKTRCYIPLSAEFSNKTIEIAIQLQNSRFSSSSLYEIILTSKNTFMIEYLRKNILLFVSAVLLLVCGFGSFIFFLLSFFTNKHRLTAITKRLFHLSIISVLTAVWSLADSHIISLFTDRILTDGILSYITLLLLALAFSEYLCSLYGENAAIKAIRLFARLNVVLQLLLFAAGARDLTETLFMTHIIFFAEIVCVITMSIASLTKFDDIEKLLLNVGNLIFAVFTALVIIAYNYNRDGNYISYAIVAFIIYCITQIAISIIRFIRNVRKQAALHEAEKYAYTDQLTKMDNRRAYSVFKKHLANSILPDDFNVIYFDLNGLKKVNDAFGHGAGDEYIIGVTDIIKRVFYDAQLRCRMGGDEFLVVLKAGKELLKKRLFYFDSLIEGWRGSIVKDISVSYGYCSACDYDSPTFEGLISKADEFMYKMKSEYYEKSGHQRRMD